jgi:LPS export ABC transporter protein LptC
MPKRLIRRRYIVTIITALVVAAYLSIDETQDSKQFAKDAIQVEPDYTIQGLSLNKYGHEGLLSQQIDSDKATHYPHNDSVSFEQPRIILRQGSTPQWGITSNEGQLIKDQILILNGNVQFVPLQQDSGVFSLSTQALNINLSEQVADTDSLVVIESDTTKLTAVGMNMNMDTQITQFKSKVRGLHDPSIQ